MARWRPRSPSSAVSALVVLAAGLVLVVVAAVIVSLVGRPGTGDDPRSGVGADRARFTYGDRSVEVPLLDCGREGDVVVMAGREGAVVLQVRADLGEGGRARTGLTVDLGPGDGILGAFGADVPPGPAGEITQVDAVGDALVVEGRWVAFDPDDLAPLPPTPGGGQEGELVARCPERGEPA